MTLTEILASFASEDLFKSTGRLLKYLGVKCSTQTEEPIPFLDIYDNMARDAGSEIPRPVREIFERVEKTFFVGAVDDDTIGGSTAAVNYNNTSAQARYNGMFIFAVQLRDGATLTRTEASVLTRGINRIVHQMPATVVILEGTTLSIATCERTAYRQTWRPGEKLGRVSILRGIDCCRPHRGHIDILETMNVKRSRTFDALYENWKKVFSTSILTENFYVELFDWYTWATDAGTKIHFPSAQGPDGEELESRETKVIRLLTRLMFVWFVKQKGLIPAELFDANYLRTILNDFDPVSDTSGVYYNAILQNLFFATLNRAIIDEDGRRRFASAANQVDSKNLYRYSELFAIPQNEVIEIFARIPFVNASLFECLDKTKTNDGVDKVYHDGFSRNDTKDARGIYRHRATVPNELFFDRDRGLFALFSRYNFTIEENTPLDQQVALDPELLGKVFENLLGVYNEETSKSARKQSGSFYTPRPMVEYKVDQALIRYLGATDFVKQIFAPDFQYNPSDASKYAEIAEKLRRLKALDPACGSGAFPVGMLNRILDLFDRMKIQCDRYELKRYIIEHCLYGVDKQSIATLITRLRFFISLIVDCSYDPSKENYGIPVLPNLENNFVTADTLVGVHRSGQPIGSDAQIVRVNEELRLVRHDHFNAKTASAKRRLVDRDKVLRHELAELLVDRMYSREDAQRLADWNPYSQNVSADFFDAEWMLGVSEGFDVVIGNPPHGAAIAPAVSLENYQLSCGETAILFIEKGLSLIKHEGLLLYVLPKPFCYASNYRRTREFVLGGLQQIVDCGKMFDKVKFEECVIILQPSNVVDAYESLVFDKTTGFSDFGLVEKNVNDEFGLFLNGTTPKEIALGRRLRRGFDRLARFVDNTRGGQVQPFVHDEGDLPVVGGKGVSRYGIVCEKGAVAESDVQDESWYCKADSLLAQNLVAHIANPVPHIKIAACFSPGIGYVIADTVNQITVLDERLSKWLLWAVLNSRLINWYSYKFIFGNAIRTMHFDAVSTDKIPVPNLSDARIPAIVSLAQEVMAAHQSNAPTAELDIKLDREICGLYGLSFEETEEIVALPS